MSSNNSLLIIDILDCYSNSDVVRKLKLPFNGNNMKRAKQYIETNKLSIAHFDPKKSSRKYIKITKICPICNSNFTTLSGSQREKQTCSHACSNTMFRSGLNYTHRELNYRSICFMIHKKECAICSESRVLDVHHLDKNKKNNNPMNLIPLCPTHHRIVHSKYKNEISDKIQYYIKNTQFNVLLVNKIISTLKNII